MITGLIIVLLGIGILIYPQILVMMISVLFILFGTGMMLTAWQFRRLRRNSTSRFVNWIVRY
jgi:hypothetical protein